MNSPIIIKTALEAHTSIEERFLGDWLEFHLEFKNWEQAVLEAT